MKRMMKKKGTMLILLAACTILFTACGKDSGSSESSESGQKAAGALETLQEEGVLRVGMCPEYPPFESITTSGEIEGFDVDLANALAKEMGIDSVEFVNTPYEGLIAGLQTDAFDLIMSGMSPEEAAEADKSLNISESYFTVSEVILTKDASITSKKDLEGKKVGSHAGSTSEYAVEGLIEEGINITSAPYNRHSEAFADLQNGNIDAQVVEDTWAEAKVKDGDGITILEEPVSAFDAAAIGQKDQKDVTDAFNKALKTIKDNGTYDEIVNKWFS